MSELVQIRSIVHISGNVGSVDERLVTICYYNVQEVVRGLITTHMG